MGAVCGKDKKPKKPIQKLPSASNHPNEATTHNKQPIQTNPVTNHQTAPPLNLGGTQNIPKVQEPQPVVNQYQESPEKMLSDEDLRDPKAETGAIGHETSHDTYVKIPTKYKVGSLAFDATTKSQAARNTNFDGTGRIQSQGPLSQNHYGSTSNVDPGTKPSQTQPTNDNTYEVIFEEDGHELEDYFLELNETQGKEYEKFLQSAQQSKTKSLKSLNAVGGALGGNKAQSHLLEWSKLLQKVCTQENPGNNPNENENKLSKAYETIIKLDERNWYEEMILLYKEKNFMSKNTANMTGLTFDRKLLQLQEQFKWLVSAVANNKLNFNNLVGVYEFPITRVPNQARKSDKLNSSNISMVSQLDPQVDEPIFSSPKQPLHQSGRRQSVLKSQMGGLFGFRGPSFEPRRNFYQELPEAMSAAWQEGFIWKGVYLRLYSKTEAEQLKREMKALKHLGVEYLQTEATTRIVEGSTYSTNNISEILEQGKGATSQIINVLLPLFCTVESSSWVLLGTPIFPIKKSLADDQSSKVVVDSASTFKNSFLLSGLTPKNFKVYYKAEDGGQGTGNTLSNTNTGVAGPHSSYLQGNQASSQHNNVFLLLTNVTKLLASLPKVNVMFIMNQEPNAHVTFLEPPKKKGLDINLIKKALGYENKDIDMSLLNKNKKSSRGDSKEFFLNMINFKSRDWSFQMLYIDSKDPLPYSFGRNKRACDLLALSGSQKEIKGNVLIFGSLSNQNSIIHPYYISDQYLTFGGDDLQTNPDPTETPLTFRVGEKKETNPAQNNSKIPRGEPESFVGGSFLKQSFKQNNLRDEKTLGEYFSASVGRSIDAVVNYLEKTDTIVNFGGLKELFHRKGLNMRFAWIVYMKVQRPRVKAMIGADILGRSLKKLVDAKTSLKQIYLTKQVKLEGVTQKDKIEEIMNEKSEFLMENYAKGLISHYINILTRSTNEASPSNPQPQKSNQAPTTINEYVDEEALYDDISTELFLSKMRLYDFAKKILSPQDFDFFLSAEIIRNIMNISCLHANVFLNSISYHLKVSINYEILRPIRNDKYHSWIAKSNVQVKPHDLIVIYQSESFLSINERCYILLLKILPNFQSNPTPTSIELTLPAALYKQRRATSPYQTEMIPFESFLRESYELPDLEVLNDWIVILESTLNGLFTLDGRQNFLIEAYILQLILAFFGEGDYDNQMTLSILERISAFLLTSPVSSPELCIAIYTWFGILLENKLIAECEQNYLRALLIIHKLYGDPRGRGGLGTPWELFITWRLSILSRLQGKTHDAEYCEELFDATLVTLKDNPLNSYLKSSPVYSDPFRSLYSTYNKGMPSDELSHLSKMPDLQKVEIQDHPFSYWTSHLGFSEASSKVDVINSTLQKTPQFLKWILTHLPTFQHTGVLWSSANLREFYLYILQSSFNNSGVSISSISNSSMERGRDRSILGGIDNISTPKSRSRPEKRDKAFDQGGNIVQMIEKDNSTFNKKEINGLIYAWGQNNDGQVGIPSGITDDSAITNQNHKKMRIYYPKGLSSLKDTIIVSVSCGHTHSMAITITRQLLAWGSNKSLQLGLGDTAPNRVYVPTLVPTLKDVQSVSCGSEHTVALVGSGNLYSWGQGEGGLLGHGDTESLSLPKKIEGLKNVEVTSVVCGGLHTLALSRQGHVYSWGRAEGGQLGLPNSEMIHNAGNNELYLTVPKRVRGAIEHLMIVQVACGDAHSLALSDKGQVYGWGYTNSGQLGLGITGDNFDPSANATLQVKEPKLIERLNNMRMKEIFSGSTFSLFLNEKKELYGCGLNDYNQLGIEKSVTKINNNLENYRHASFNRTTESPVPKLIDCFTLMPILNVACGENHSLALVFFDSYYMIFAWGMQRHGQLGIGDVQQPYSTPRPISFLQHAMSYSMACGAYHSLVVLGEASKNFKKEALVDRLERKTQNKWSSISYSLETTYEAMIEQAIANLDSIIPSEEGKIDNPKAIKKAI